MKFYRNKSILGNVAREAFKPVRNKVKGKIGELKVENALNLDFLNGEEHRQINNLMIVDELGKSHQIDHIVIRKNGIFCIETKNYQGLIFGEEKQEQWTQVIYKERYKFTNPIKQNKSHIYQISRILEGMYRINSIIVMVQNNADNIAIPYVVNLRELTSYLNSYYDGTDLSDREMDIIYGILQRSANYEITNKDHIRNIHATKDNLDNNICPRCNGSLILKNGKYGPFYGCENYPKCNFTKKL